MGLVCPRLNSEKNLGLHTQSREQRVKRFPQLPPHLPPFQHLLPLYVVTQQSAAGLNPTHSPLRRGPLVHTAALPKYPSSSRTTRLYKMLSCPGIQSSSAWSWHRCSTGTTRALKAWHTFVQTASHPIKPSLLLLRIKADTFHIHMPRLHYRPTEPKCPGHAWALWGPS